MKHYSSTCQYYGEEAHPCGKPSYPEKSYCADHVWVVYRQGSNAGSKRKAAALEREIKQISILESIEPIE